MDEISARLKSLERKIRTLLAVVVVLTAAVAAQVLGWIPTLRPSQGRTDRIVLASQDGLHGSVEISNRGIHLLDQDSGGETWLTAPSRGDSAGLSVSGPSGFSGVGAGEVRVTANEGGTVEVRGGARPGIVILGGKDGQVDIGPGFTAVSGSGGATVIDGRRDSLGVRVIDAKGNVVPPR